MINTQDIQGIQDVQMDVAIMDNMHLSEEMTQIHEIGIERNVKVRMQEGK